MTLLLHTHSNQMTLLLHTHSNQMTLTATHTHTHTYTHSNQMSWRYQNLAQALDKKQSEVEQLSQDFESKLRAKEVRE